MAKNKNKPAGAKYWEEQVNGFCGIFGFRVAEDICVSPGEGIVSVLLVKAGRARVYYKTPGGLGETPLSDTFEPGKSESAFRRLLAAASGAELVVRSTDKDRKTPYGFTKVRLVRHILLPEFGSVEELKLKLAASGEGEP